MRIFTVTAFLVLLHVITDSAFAGTKSAPPREKILNLVTIANSSPKIQQNKLPAPYRYLLSQPLLTKGIEQYYQRKAVIRKISAFKNARNNSYSRTIIMLIDSNKTRIVELAFISINFKALPEAMRIELLTTNIPFGTLLEKYKIKFYTTDRSYFYTQCDEKIAALLHCNLRKTVYGRRNTIRQKANNIWLAKVVEILP